MNTQVQRVDLPLSQISVSQELNGRYRLDKAKVKALKDSILENGLIHPIEVNPMAGDAYVVTLGNYRYAAVSQLHQEGKWGDTIPVSIVPISDPKESLKRNLTENLDRKSLSPMDTSAAIVKMREAGFNGKEICETFDRSNSWVNLMETLLSLPKQIQVAIDTETISVEAALRLAATFRKSPERVSDIFKKAQEIHAAEVAKEEETLEKYEADLKEAEVKAKAAEAKAEQEAKIAALEEKDPDKAKELKAKFREAAKAAKEAEKKRKEAEAKKAEAKSKKIGVESVTKAESDGPVPLNKKEIMEIFEAMSLPAGEATATEKKVIELGKLTMSVINGVMTDKQYFKKVSALFGGK